jgi:hypothetical protein
MFILLCGDPLRLLLLGLAAARGRLPRQGVAAIHTRHKHAFLEPAPKIYCLHKMRMSIHTPEYLESEPNALYEQQSLVQGSVRRLLLVVFGFGSKEIPGSPQASLQVLSLCNKAVQSLE